MNIDIESIKNVIKSITNDLFFLFFECFAVKDS